MDNSELENIINSCKKKHSKAQEALYRHFSSKMFAVCRRYSSNREEAEDILQEGFVIIFNKIGDYSSKGSFEGWIRRIFVNIALEKFRKNKPILLNEDYKEVNNTIENETEWRIGISELIQLIEQLSPQYRLVFNLYVFEDYSHKEIAQELGITEGTSKSNLARARQILQKAILKIYK